MYNIIRLAALALLFAACAPTEEPFKGTDSSILAFSLQQGHSIFDAAIAGDLITVTVPEGLSLNLARASVQVSEGATIAPDPAEIDAWEEERLFVVTARDGSRTVYKYTVAREGLVHDGAVTLLTQEELERFGQSGVTRIEGDLVIGSPAGADSITSLAPLSALREVVRGVTLRPTCAFVDLAGLHNLRSVGDTFLVGALPRLEAFALPALRRAGGISVANAATVVVDLPELAEISDALELNCPLFRLQLPALQRATSLRFTTASSGSAAVIEEIALPALTETAGGISVSNFKSLTALRLPKLKKMGGDLLCGSADILTFIYAPLLEEVAKISLSNLGSLAEIDMPSLVKTSALYVDCKNLSVLSFPVLTRAGSLEIRNAPIATLSEFRSLQEVDAASFYNLPKLTKVSFPLTLKRLDALAVEYRTGYGSLSEVNVKGIQVGALSLLAEATRAKLVGDEVFAGTLKIDPYPVAATVASAIPFPALEGFAEVDSLCVLSRGMLHLNMSGIRKVRRGAFIQSTSANAPQTFQLPDLDEVGGNFTINFTAMGKNAAFTAVRFDKLKRIGGAFAFTALRGAPNALSCPELESIGGDFLLSTCYDRSTYVGLSALDFPKLSAIGGKLAITPGHASYTNARLASLDGFSALASVQSIDVSRQAALVDYSGLRTVIGSLSPDSWTVSGNSYNPTLQQLQAGQWIKP